MHRLIVISPAALATAALLAVTLALAAAPVSAEPPPAAAGTTSHGFLAKGGVFSPIDHPDATIVPAVPSGQAGTATTGINNRGQIVGTYEGRDRVVRHFLLDRGSRSPRSRIRPGKTATRSTSTSTSTTAGRSSASTTTPKASRPPASCARRGDGSWTSAFPAPR